VDSGIVVAVFVCMLMLAVLPRMVFLVRIGERENWGKMCVALESLVDHWEQIDGGGEN
jgi:hypothetical protein